MSDSGQVTGRRLDVNDGSSLVLFRGADPKVNYGTSSKRPNDNDMLDFVRAQEQKLKLEKLKWHENNAKIVALKSKPAVVTVNSNTKTAATQQQQKASAVALRKTLSPPESKKPISKEALNPKHVAELIDNRNKRASEWLHGEQREVSTVLLFFVFFPV